MPDKQCLCGSGKKKNGSCYRNNNVIDLNQYRRWRTGQHLRRKLAEFADSEVFWDEMEIARELYFSVMDPEVADEKDDFLLERFFEWFIFDYRIRGRSVLEYFLMAGELSSAEKVLLEKWRLARTSVYQVKRIEQDCGIVLWDLVRNKEALVKDCHAAREVEPGQLVFIRIIDVGGECEFSTGGLILPGYCKNYIMNRIKVDAELYWSKYNRRGSWNTYLRDRAHVLNAIITETSSVFWDFAEEEYFPGEPVTQENEDRDMEELFMDYFYERWINEPMDLLEGKTPLEAYGTKSGREKLKKLLLDIEKIENGNKGPSSDLTKLWYKLITSRDLLDTRDCYDDVTEIGPEGDGGVSELISDGLKKMGYRAQHVKSAMEIWRRYQSIAQPVFRKPGAWAAAVIYAMTKTMGNGNISQSELASMFNVSTSTISSYFSSIRRTLRLDG